MSYKVCGGKNMWPELLGANGETAKSTIERENPGVTAWVMPAASAMRATSSDFKCNRCVVWVNSQGIVVRMPNVH
ncbi:hypothetical protein ACHQM5_005449 [Ranunculus cassubicifolius]